MIVWGCNSDFFLKKLIRSFLLDLLLLIPDLFINSKSLSVVALHNCMCVCFPKSIFFPFCKIMKQFFCSKFYRFRELIHAATTISTLTWTIPWCKRLSMLERQSGQAARKIAYLLGAKVSNRKLNPFHLLPVLNLCSFCRDLHWKDAPVSMMPTIKWLLEHGLPVWLYR